MDSNFFIADRLRGIPLVSHAASAKKPIIDDDKSTRSSEAQIPNRMVEVARTVQVEKRNAEDKQATRAGNQMPRGSTGTSGLLFRPAAMTAATSSITKKRPAEAPTTTTTRRPATRRPTTTHSRASKVVAPTKPMPASTNRPILAKMLMKDPERPQQRPATTAPPQLISSTLPMTSSSGQARPKEERQRTSAVEYSEAESTRGTPNLTRATQEPLTTQPGFQRRTPQTVLASPRYTNKLNDGGRTFAGENWTLFNRTDGHLAVFEVLVLLSSIMIVSTVVFVILFNWIKSIQSKLEWTIFHCLKFVTPAD